MLLENLKLNNVKNVRAFNLGIAKDEGVKRLYFAPKSFHKASLIPDKSKPLSLTIRTIPLQSVIEDNRLERIDFLKMDCEGAEYEILLNTPLEILRSINKMSIECHCHPTYSIKDLKVFLEKIGFRVYVKTKMLYAKKISLQQ